MVAKSQKAKGSFLLKMISKRIIKNMAKKPINFLFMRIVSGLGRLFNYYTKFRQKYGK